MRAIESGHEHQRTQETWPSSAYQNNEAINECNVNAASLPLLQ